MITPKSVGARIKRREDPRLITGRATYTDDIKLPRMAHVAFARSMYAHAKLNSVDVSKAKAMPGVLLVLTGDDIAGKTPEIPVGLDFPGLKVPPHGLLAVGRVRFVGEPIALVVATDRYKARDAAEAIEIDADPLEVVVDLEKAVAGGAPLLHDQIANNICFHNVGGQTEQVDQAFKSADHVVKLRIEQQRLVPMAMEARATVADYNPSSKELTVWTSTQIPHMLRTQLSEGFGIPESRLRVVAPEVGGGFGAKLNCYPEEMLVPYLSIRLGRPIKWAQTRREDIAATIHGRGQVEYVEAAVKKDGTVTAMTMKYFVDCGAYFQFFTPMISGFSWMLMHGCYKVPAVGFEQIGVLTNKMSTDAYRGAGRPEAAFIAERLMDEIAALLKMDPVEVRRKNFIGKEAFPYTTPAGLVFDSGDYEKSLAKALEIADYAKLRREQAEARKQGRLMGIGVSTYLEICGLGPSALFHPKIKVGGWESGGVKIDPSGTVTVLTGISPHGQGEETSFAQIVADELGVEMEDVTVLHGDTAVVHTGVGTFGSRGLALGGTALKMSLDKVKEKMRRIASHMMEAPPESLEFGGGRIFLKNAPDKAIAFMDVVAAAYGFKANIPGIEPGLEAQSFYEPVNALYPFGAHVSVVEVDADTGHVDLKRYVAVDDCGNQVNPMLVEGQVHGGIAQGIAQALYETVVYDEGGQLVTGTLMDYAVPKAAMIPTLELESTVTPTPVNPLGAKGVGEAGTIGSTPCVVNAVLDALRPLGVKTIDMPLWPEKIWRAMAEAKATRPKGGAA